MAADLPLSTVHGGGKRREHLLKTGADDGVSRLAYKQRMATADPRR